MNTTFGLGNWGSDGQMRRLGALGLFFPSFRSGLDGDGYAGTVFWQAWLASFLVHICLSGFDALFSFLGLGGWRLVVGGEVGKM